jgi:hypothetical protein
MPKAKLKVVNPDMPEQTTQATSGISLRTVIIVTLVTTVASQLVIDGYRAVKGKIKEKRAAANPELPPVPGMLPSQAMLPPPGGLPGQQVPMFAPHTSQGAAARWRGAPEQNELPEEPESNPEPEPPRALNEGELAEWQRALERKERNLESWERDLHTEQRHLRLVGSS